MAKNLTPRTAHFPVIDFLATAVAYGVASWFSLMLAIPPGYASPLFVAAGVAMAATLIGGPRMLPAVTLASFVNNLALDLRHAPFAASMLPLPLWIGLGAALQAYCGAWLVRRHTEQPLTLSQPRDVLNFLACAAASCLISTGMGNLGLWWAGKIPLSALPASGAAWWIGDLLGVLIAVPVILSVLGMPRSAWAPRRLSVGLTLAMATLVLALGIHWVTRSDIERRQTAFNHEATSALQALSVQLSEPLQALQALHDAFEVSDHIDAQDMRLVTRSWLASGRIQAMAWSQRLRRSEVAAFEARARADGVAQYTVFDRGLGHLPDDPDAEIIAVRYIEPLASNAPALGLNVLSIPATRDAVEATLRTDAPAASSGLMLTQDAAGSNQIGVVIYRALYTAGDGAVVQTVATSRLRGVVSVVLRMQDQLTALAARNPTHLAVCVIDTTPGQPQMRLAGAVGCEALRVGLQQQQQLSYAGRVWTLRATALPGQSDDVDSTDAWLFALVGLLSTAMLGGFLLTLTGRANRIEIAVQERTAALQAEVREREVAEAALRESEQRFRNILNNVPIGVIYTDLRGRLKQINPRFCQLIGYGEKDMLRMSLADFTHPHDMEQDATLMAQLVRGEIPMYRGHKRYITQQHQTVWVQVTVSLLRDAQGKPRSIVGVVEDITEHLRLEEAERARESAEASNRAKSDFLSRMSHELRTPLNAMLGFAQLLEMDAQHPLDATQQPWVGQIQQAGWHLLDMINDVLDLSRIESGNLRLQHERLKLADVFDACLAMVAGDAQKRQITLAVDIASGAATVRADATRVKQILTNLLSNAVKYNVDAGHIDVVARSVDAEAVEITVSDTGLGMTAQQLADLFQPFNRLGREVSSKQGTGIGLVISKRLAEALGGSLRARSAAGQGSAFILTLPGSTDPDSEHAALDELAPSPASYHRRTVHYVEDNETNIEVMRGILAQRPQVELCVSINGRDGLEAIRRHTPDLILLDMHLPDMNGLQILRELRTQPQTFTTPIVVVSADALPQQIEAAFAEGCTQYLTKPVSVIEVLQVVDDILDRIDTHFG